jgi:hypothetical protein
MAVLGGRRLKRLPCVLTWGLTWGLMWGLTRFAPTEQSQDEFKKAHQVLWMSGQRWRVDSHRLGASLGTAQGIWIHAFEKKDGQRAAQLHPVPNGPAVVDPTAGPFTLRKSNNGSSVG